MNELDIVTLNNQKDYVISKIMTYKNKNYLYLMQVDDNNNILDENIILEKVKINNKIYLKKVNNTLTNKILLEKFTKIILEEAK